MDYSELLPRNHQGGYINVTPWFKEFGKKVAEWKRSTSTKARAKSLHDRLRQKHKNKDIRVIYTEGKGRGARTYCHPIMAIHAASYLSPDFSNYVAQVFKSYLDADPQLAANIIERQDNEEIADWIQKRAQGKVARLQLTGVLKAHGVSIKTLPNGKRVNGYAVCTNALYLGLFGKTAKQIKQARQSKHTRDAMNTEELAELNLAEATASNLIQRKNLTGNEKCEQACQKAAKHISEAIQKIYEE